MYRILVKVCRNYHCVAFEDIGSKQNKINKTHKKTEEKVGFSLWKRRGGGGCLKFARRLVIPLKPDVCLAVCLRVHACVVYVCGRIREIPVCCVYICKLFAFFMFVCLK